MKKPVGSVTRGTTNPNRLRRIDRFVVAQRILREEPTPILVDLGYGASPITAVELSSRARKVNPAAQVVGIEIERERVERGLAVATDQLHFALGGFEVPLPNPPFDAGEKVHLIRAFNVLRQYSEDAVADAWALMCARLAPGGLLVEGTCDEIGRLASWVTLDSLGPQTFTISLRLTGLELPSKVAERLPKALIHHNLPGENIHDYLLAIDTAWRLHSPLATFGAVQRWVATCETLVAQGWPITVDRKRWRLGELTVAWVAVAPK
ncbi:MAG: hypothetical protein RLZ28_921 [Actinomycetota bacterium]